MIETGHAEGSEPADMASYYTLLQQKIKDSDSDPALMRQLVYEAARLALRRQASLAHPPLSVTETRRQLHELEAAIAQVELDLASTPNVKSREKTYDGAGFAASFPRRPARTVREPIEAENDEEEAGPRKLLDSVAWERDEPPARKRSRGLVLVPERLAAPRRSNYLLNPSEFVHPDVIYQVPAPPRHSFLSALKITFQIVVAALAAGAFYVAMWVRSATLQTAPEMRVAGAAGQPPQGERVALAAEPAGASAAFAAVAPAPTLAAPTPVALALPFAPPTAYGVYAVASDRLIELDHVAAAPVDPRTRSQLQIVSPARVVIPGPKLAFLLYRRDLVTSAPDKVPVRIAAHIAHSMNFDSSGKAMITMPQTDTWLIRDKGYDLRVSPVRDSAEMMMLRPEDPEFSFPSGRYELMLGGQPYDFVVGGAVTDPGHCVEGVATVRGPVFYECKGG